MPGNLCNLNFHGRFKRARHLFLRLTTPRPTTQVHYKTYFNIILQSNRTYPCFPTKTRYALSFPSIEDVRPACLSLLGFITLITFGF
jgi:hypothetical protein